ncbi:MAG: phosphonate metabolism protein/1,5-bisphosphokinase (PRPP-forming) PhnN [Pseudomonadota bacterium]
MTGWLIQVTGPSGVGKDTLLDGARRALAAEPNLRFVRRVITRAADAGGEDHEPIDEAAFAARAADGGFFACWQAHGLGYGVPLAVAAWLAAGQTVVLNGSRAAAPAIAARCPRTVLIAIEAPEAVLEARLAARGREDAEAIRQRRARAVPPPPEGIERHVIVNDTTVDAGIDRLTALIRAIAARTDVGRAAGAEAPA